MCALEVNDREGRCHFGTSGGFFHSVIASSRSRRLLLCLGRASFSFLPPPSRGRCSLWHFELTAILITVQGAGQDVRTSLPTVAVIFINVGH